MIFDKLSLLLGIAAAGLTLTPALQAQGRGGGAPPAPTTPRRLPPSISLVTGFRRSWMNGVSV